MTYHHWDTQECIQNSNILFQEIVFENAVCKMFVILVKPQYVKLAQVAKTHVGDFLKAFDSP